MKNYTEIIADAKKKTHLLDKDNTQIRLYGCEEMDCEYYVFRKNNLFYVGYFVEKPMPKLIPNRPIYTMANSQDVIIGYLQRLK